MEVSIMENMIVQQDINAFSHFYRIGEIVLLELIHHRLLIMLGLASNVQSNITAP